MNFLQLAKARYSLRKYSDKPVEPEKIDAIMAAASLAPTGCNNQPQRILIVDDPAILDKIRHCTSYQFGAPVTLVVCYDSKVCWYNHEGEPIGPIDCAIVVDHIQLEAAEQGLGTCWVGSFDHKALQKELNLPKDYVPVALVPLGYPAADAKPAHLHAEHRPASTFAWKNHFDA